MIEFTCDKCDTLIELDDKLAGTKHVCLNCGDTNIVPSPDHGSTSSGPSDTKKVDRAAAAGYPADFGPEVRVLKVRRCWFRSRPVRFSLVALVLVGSLVMMLWAKLGDHGTAWLILGVLLTLASALTLAWWWVDRLAAALEVTTNRTIMHRGFFSRSTSEVVHDNIRNIQVNQSFTQRITNVGRVGISSSGQDGIEISVNHLPDPKMLREIIDLYRPM